MSLTSYRAAPPRDVPVLVDVVSIPRPSAGVKRFCWEAFNSRRPASPRGPRRDEGAAHPIRSRAAGNPWAARDQEAPGAVGAAGETDAGGGHDVGRRSVGSEEEEIAAGEVGAVPVGADGERLRQAARTARQLAVEPGRRVRREAA